MKQLWQRLQWYYATRAVGLLVLGLGLYSAHSPDRTTLIVTGAGLIGVDKVARSEHH